MLFQMFESDAILYSDKTKELLRLYPQVFESDVILYSDKTC